MSLRVSGDFLSLASKKDSERTVEIYNDHILGKEPFLIVDGSNIFQQAFHASKGSMYNSKGNETGGIVIFINIILNYISSLNPKKVFCTVDYGMSARRASLFKNYKSGRKEQRATKDALLGAEAAAEERENYFYQFNNTVEFLKYTPIILTMLKAVEADSSIAYFVGKIRKIRKHNNTPIIIISTDKDFYQLFSHKNVYIFNPRTKQFIDKKNFHSKLNLDECVIPEQLPLIRSIMGDNSDSIPGVLIPKENPKATRQVGIGGKTISKLYREASNEDFLIKNFDDIESFLEGKKSLKKFEKAILDNRKLIDLNIQLMDLINIDKYMSVNALTKLDGLFEYKPELQSKPLYDFFKKNDCQSYILSFQTIKRILNELGKKKKKSTTGIDWNKI